MKRQPSDGGLRQLFFKHLKTDASWTPIETFLVASGVPDAHYIFRGGIAGWLELKQTAGWKPIIAPLQIAWQARYTRLGGRVWIAVRRAPASLDELYMVRGRAVADLASFGLRGCSETDVIKCGAGGPGKWWWGLVRKALTE